MNKFFIFCILLNLGSSLVWPQDVFVLKSEVINQHPRILFTQSEADSLGLMARTYLKTDYDTMISHCRKFSYPTNYNSSTWGQSIWWRLCRLAIASALSKESWIIDSCKIWLGRLDQDANFSEVELNPAHLVAAYALAYDCVYPYLSETERQTCQTNLQTAVQAYYDATLQPAYWSHDYANNHMHFRLTALLYSILALYGDDNPSIQSIADQCMTYFRRVDYSLGPDGSSHEGLNYMKYGHNLLIPAIIALKHCTELDITKKAHYRNIGYYYLYHVTPGWKQIFGFGDCTNEHGGFSAFLFRIANDTKDGFIQAAALNLYNQDPDDFWQQHWNIIHRDPFLSPGNISLLPLHRFFDDIGICICRSDWSDTATAVAFKCGPMGGKQLNITRGTEYDPHNTYVNVAHDDPDAGTFLLFTNKSFITTGDGYEKEDKITTQHSTFIVDDATQFGGGGTWSQPQSVDKWAWPKDYFCSGERVVFSGNMQGVYSNMDYLVRTFVSQEAKYILIYDHARSSTGGRTFEWRLQTEGDLTDLGDKVYRVSNGGGSALVKLYSPDEGNWSTTSNKIGNILRVRLTGQQENRFLVLIWPGGDDLSMVEESYNTASGLGLKVSRGGVEEYSLFCWEEGRLIEVGDIECRGNTVLLVVDKVSGELLRGLVVNGDSLLYKGVEYFSSDNLVDYSIEYIEVGGGGGIYRVVASSGSDTVSGVHIKIGGLRGGYSYPVEVNGEYEGEVSTDSEGRLSMYLALDTVYTINIGQVSKIDLDLANQMSLSKQIKILSKNFNLTGGKIKLNNSFAQEVDIDLYDSRGKFLKNIFSRFLAPGKYEVKFNYLFSTSGIYFIRINRSRIVKILIL